MSSRIKIWLFLAALLIILGSLMFAIAMSINHWDFTKLSTIKYKTETYQLSDDFSNIFVEAATADIEFSPSDDGKCSVICFGKESSEYSVDIHDNALIIRENTDDNWQNNIGISLSDPKISVALPSEKYVSLIINSTTGDIELPECFGFENIEITLTTGDINERASAAECIAITTITGGINIKGVSADRFDLAVTTGDITISDTNCLSTLATNVSTGHVKITDALCTDIVSNGTTGDIILNDVIAMGNISITRTTGDVVIADSDAADITVKTTTGDVSGNLLTEKVFIVQTSTGSIDVPHTYSGGKCELSTSTGDIRFRIN